MIPTEGPASDIVLERLMALHPKKIDLVLDRMHRLLARLGHPERSLPPVVHVAGTNGKGSTCAMIRAGLEGAGHRVHVYTSPHLARFHERIRVAGDLIPEAELIAVLEECEAVNGGEPITYFEITTCAALLAFSRTPADFCVLEVGLGGRLDATNVVDRPALTVITMVDLDHQPYLGDTLTEIAGEKAGIMKPDVPCVVSRQHEAARDAIEARAESVGAPLLLAGQDWDARAERGRLIVQDDRGLLDLPLPSLPGPHQIGNAGTAVVALRRLLPEAKAHDAAFEAAMRPHWPARMQRLAKGPLVEMAPGAELWLDGGHNPAAGRAIAATLAAMPPRPTHLICGMLNTKDVTGFMVPLAGHADSLTAVAIPGEDAPLPAEDTAAAARAAGIETRVAGGVREALAHIVMREPAARVLICGSLYLAGHVLRTNG